VTSDEELMRAYASGDESRFSELFDRYAPLLLRVLGRDLSRSDASDLVQQTFLQIHRHRRDYDPTRTLRPWVLTIALNLKREHFRRAKARPEAELSDAVVQRLAAPPASQSRVEHRQRLLRALEPLSEDQKEVILLHWLEGIPMPDVARIVGVSLSATKLRAHRGYAAMRAHLGRIEGEEG
jgi:RNA polymerase sigma-70 factor (ECF subfamily)